MIHHIHRCVNRKSHQFLNRREKEKVKRKMGRNENTWANIYFQVSKMDDSKDEVKRISEAVFFISVDDADKQTNHPSIGREHQSDASGRFEAPSLHQNSGAIVLLSK